MSLQVDGIYQGFKVLAKNTVAEIQSQAWLLQHEKSGARLLYLENNDDNKVFSVSFRTPPLDDTGVPHIVEHSVLCGSRKFPLKEPFVELVKGSLNTFLNAMTYPDKTVYPVASRNDKDFRNLMDVYLDAVFFPLMYDNPQVLMQEGWHYELAGRDSELIYKGVVYNEMKGAFSSPDAVLETAIFSALFPATAYGRESGGDPDYIPDLTQEKFIDFHRRYYHPANSYIYLYGDLDIMSTLAFIDREYLSRFSRTDIDSEILLQPPFKQPVQTTAYYPVAADDTAADKSYLSLSFVVGTAADPEVYLAYQILEHLLLETPAAPLKKALLSAGIGSNVFGSFAAGILQPTLSICTSGAKETDREKFAEIVFATLAKLADQGIDKKLVAASLNLIEFKLREANFGSRPQGLIYNIRCLDSWLYGADPLLHLAYDSTLEKIKAGLDQGYFERLIKEGLLNNNHRAVVLLAPQPGLGEKRAAELKEKLAAHKSGLTAAEIDELVARTAGLKARQEQPDPPEKLAVIPLLRLKDIRPEAEQLPLAEKTAQGVPVLFHSLPTNNIGYLNMYFDTRAVPQELLPYLHLLARVLGKIGTEKYDYTDLANEINLHTGGLTYEAVALSQNGDDYTYYPKFKIKIKTLLKKLPQTMALAGQIIGRGDFSDQRRLAELVREIRSEWERNLFRLGQQIAAGRVLSYLSPAAAYNETGLLSFAEFIAGLEKQGEAKLAEISAKLQTTADLVFSRNQLLLSITAAAEDYDSIAAELPGFFAYLNDRKNHGEQYRFRLKPDNEGLMTSGKVQFVAQGANFRRLGYSYSGTMKVLETILRYDYLWNRIRVQGGAYGAFAQLERTGNMVFCSYRDPNLTDTLTVYRELPAYLENFKVTGREMTKYIIGTISQIDMPLTAQMKGIRAAENYIRQVRPADRQQEREEILATTPQDIRNLAPLVRDALKEQCICVLGSEQKIKENKAVFGKLHTIR